MVWTQFWDMHSGGRCKEDPYEMIYIEAPKEEAIVIFYNRFGHNPHRVTCTCCGNDYSISQSKTLTEATKFQREDSLFTGTRKKITLAQYKKQKDVLIIRKADIKDEERKGEVPEQGYVWR